MYGWIFATFESLIIEKYGLDKWEEIHEMAECTIPTGEFIKSLNYSDELIIRLLFCAEKILGQPQDLIIQFIGEHFVTFFQANGYKYTLRAQGRDFGEMLQNLNEPHRLLRSRFPESYLPEFWCTAIEKHGEEYSCILHYYSQRGKLFYPLAVGLIKELGRQFYNARVELEMHSQFQEDSYVHTIILVKYTEDKTKSLVRINSESFVGPNRVLKCPFTGATLPARRGSRESPLNHQGSVGLSSSRVCDLFPFHIVVNDSLEVIQYGKKLKSFLRMDEKQDVVTIDELFAFQLPANLLWSWETLLSLQGTSVSFFALNRKGTVIFRGNIIILDPITDPGVNEPSAMILLNPLIDNLEEMEALEMKLSDFPVHGFQRDLMMLGSQLIDIDLLFSLRAYFQANI